MQLVSEVSGQCRIRGNDNYFRFSGMFVSFCVRDRERPYYRGLGGVELKGYFAKLPSKSSSAVYFDAPVLFDLETLLENATFEVNIDPAVQIVELRDAVRKALIVSLREELGIELE